MTILLEEYNRKIANRFFDKKKEMYKKSELPLNKRLKDYGEFGSDEVEERQQEMAKAAEILWKV
jgi:RNA-splicing ligase RtcB